RGPGGGLLEYHIQDGTVKGEGKSRINVLFFINEKHADGEALKVASMDVDKNPDQNGLWGKVSLPEVKWKWFQPTYRKAVALVTHKSGGYVIKVDDIIVSNKCWGIVFGLTVVIALLFIVLRLFNSTEKWVSERRKLWNLILQDRAGKLIAYLFRLPLFFTVTPLGRYSISLAQILFWSLLVLFAFAYILWVRGESLEITSQILTLLGISGGTAVAAKAAAMARARDIPHEFFKDAD
ncbi:MAG: hypothetical protein GWN86_10030, partial [Desulfobacterales bacterium]|nr:hypothetical protein [Desulfobacterales bacterium]